MMHKVAARNFSTSKYKALCRMGLCSGSASSNSNRAALSVNAWAVHTWAALLDRTGCRKPDGVGCIRMGYTGIDCEWAAHAWAASGGQRQWFRGEKYSGFSRHTECFIASCFMRQIEGC